MKNRPVEDNAREIPMSIPPYGNHGHLFALQRPFASDEIAHCHRTRIFNIFHLCPLETFVIPYIMSACRSPERSAVAFWAGWDMTGCMEVNQLATLLAFQGADRSDFSGMVQAGQLGALFQSHQFQPGAVGYLEKHVQQSLFDEGDVKTQPITQFLVWLGQETGGIIEGAVVLVLR